MAVIDTASQTYSSGGQTYDAHTGQVVTSPTVPTPVVATAPTGQTSTTSGPATPTAVVSSALASNAATNMKDTAVQAQADMVAQNAARAANQGKPGYDIFGNKLSGAPIPTGGAATPVTPPTPEQQIADTPDAGYRWLYDASGNRIQMGVNDAVPTGYGLTNPKVPPTVNVSDSATDSVGNTYKQFADGTYGKFDATGAYQGVASANDFQATKAGQGVFDSLNKALNGTYPLTADQQAQIDGIKATFASLIEQQKTANANFTGATTTAENLYGMGNSLAGLGEIKGTVDAGLAKVADLNNKLASTVAQMTSAFKTDNLNMLKTAYDEYTGLVKSRQDEFDKLTAAATAAAKDARDFAETQKMDALTKMMNDHTISYQDKQQALAESQFSEEQKQHIIDNQYKDLQYKLDVRKQSFLEKQATSGPGFGSDLPAVTTSPDGKIDPVSQQKLLDSLPGGPNGDLAVQVKGLADYSLNPTDFTVRTLKGGTQMTRDQMVALAKRYDPSYDEKLYAPRQALIKNFTSGVYSQKINALNTATGHIATLTNDVNKLGNTNFGPGNIVKNAVLPLVGFGPTAGAKLSISGVTGELANAFKASGATDHEIKSLSVINANSTPADIQAYVTSATELMASKISEIENTYSAGMGKAPTSSFLSSDAIEKLSDLKNKGYTIDIPNIHYTDKDAYMKDDPSAAANMQTAIQQLQAAGLPLTPENILQLAQSQQ
jgi:hypothetical protein